jgi:gluconolactonase
VKTGDTIVVADNWFGVLFNGPNNIVVKSNGSVWFTDPIYAR